MSESSLSKCRGLENQPLFAAQFEVMHFQTTLINVWHSWGSCYLNADFQFKLGTQLVWRLLHVDDHLCGTLRRKKVSRAIMVKVQLHEGKLREVTSFCL